MSKIELNIDSTSLQSSGCIKEWFLKIAGNISQEGIIEGGYSTKAYHPAMVYGVAVHKYTDRMYKTKGHVPSARKAAEEVFQKIPTDAPPKGKDYLKDTKHMLSTCYTVWTEFIEQEKNFEVLEFDMECWSCKGIKNPATMCSACSDLGHCLQPATEITFSIPYYEDETIKVNLCGTIDTIGKFHNGIYAIRDFKTTSSWDVDDYFVQYDMSRQLRLYTLACKLMAKDHPESVLGRIGATKMGAFIDAIFLNKLPNETKFGRSNVFTYSDKEIEEFDQMLKTEILKLSYSIKLGIMPREGIMNGSCVKQYGQKCMFWYPCSKGGDVEKMMLKRDFVQKPFSPLNYNDV